MSPHNICAFITWGGKQCMNRRRDQISNLPADFRQLSIAWILTITRDGSLVPQQTVSCYISPTLLLCGRVTTNLMEPYLSMNSEWNSPELRVCVKQGGELKEVFWFAHTGLVKWDRNCPVFGFGCYIEMSWWFTLTSDTLCIMRAMCFWWIGAPVNFYHFIWRHQVPFVRSFVSANREVICALILGSWHQKLFIDKRFTVVQSDGRWDILYRDLINAYKLMPEYLKIH